MTDTKTTNCTRRVVRASGLICKPPRRGSMTGAEHIAAVRAHNRHITLRDCEDCPMKTTETPDRPKCDPPPVVPEGTPLPGDELGDTETPSETPQKPHIEPPAITPLGTLSYARTGWEPPPAPLGWHRDDSDPEVWKFVPDRSICRHLTISPGEIGACGYHRVTRHCGLIDAFVGPITCTKCQKGEAHDGTW